MTATLRNLTPTQIESYNRREKFRRVIEEGAAKLRAAKMSEAVASLGRQLVAPFVAQEAAPETLPAGTDPSAKAAPHFCERCKAALEQASPKAYPSVRSIQIAICDFYSLDRVALTSRRRTKEVIRPRQVGYFLSSTLTPLSLPAIGRLFGGRDHTTVLHGVQKIRARLEAGDDDLSIEIAEVLALMPKRGKQ